MRGEGGRTDVVREGERKAKANERPARQSNGCLVVRTVRKRNLLELPVDGVVTTEISRLGIPVLFLALTQGSSVGASRGASVGTNSHL